MSSEPKSSLLHCWAPSDFLPTLRLCVQQLSIIVKTHLHSDLSDLPFYSRRNRLAADILASVFAHLNQICPSERGNPTTIATSGAMVISHEWRATGLAQIIVEYMLLMCRAAGAASVLAVVTNLRGQHLTSKLGLKILSEFDFRNSVEQEGVLWKPQPDDPKSIQLTCYQFPK